MTADTKRYDRQIRLWGKETQLGLQGARILVLGVNGLCNEIVKNLVLAGVGRKKSGGCLDILDATTVTAKLLETGGLFSVGTDPIGKPLAEVLCSEMRLMNPSVNLTALVKTADQLDAAAYRSYHFVIGTSFASSVRSPPPTSRHTHSWHSPHAWPCPTPIPPAYVLIRAHAHRPQVSEIARITRLVEGNCEVAEDDPIPKAKRRRTDAFEPSSNGSHVVEPMRNAGAQGDAMTPKFLAAGSVGLRGFCFFDLGVATVKVPAAQKRASADAPATSAADAAKDVLERAVYPSVEAAANVPWACLGKRVPGYYCALQLLREHQAAPAPPTDESLAEASALLPTASPASMRKLASILCHRAAALSTATANSAAASAAAEEKVTPALVAHLASEPTELAPVTAVVGGVIASEVSPSRRPVRAVTWCSRPFSSAPRSPAHSIAVRRPLPHRTPPAR